MARDKDIIPMGKAIAIIVGVVVGVVGIIGGGLFFGVQALNTNSTAVVQNEPPQNEPMQNEPIQKSETLSGETIEEDIIGTWKRTFYPDGDEGEEYYFLYQFNSDGSGIQNSSYNDLFGGASNFTYEFSGNSLILTWSDGSGAEEDIKIVDNILHMDGSEYVKTDAGELPDYNYESDYNDDYSNDYEYETPYHEAEDIRGGRDIEDLTDEEFQDWWDALPVEDDYSNDYEYETPYHDAEDIRGGRDIEDLSDEEFQEWWDALPVE